MVIVTPITCVYVHMLCVYMHKLCLYMKSREGRGPAPQEKRKTNFLFCLQKFCRKKNSRGMRTCLAGDEEDSYEFQLQEQECAKLMGTQEEHVAPATKDDKTLCVNDSTVHETRGSMRTSFWDRLAPHFPQVSVLKAACALMTCIMCVRISYVSYASSD